MKIFVALILVVFCGACSHQTVITESGKLKALIVDGQNNHVVWPKSTVMLKQYLEQSGLFEVEVYRSKPMWKVEAHHDYLNLHSDGSHFRVEKPRTDPSFAPDFEKYDLVVSNFGYNAADWPRHAELAFEKYMKNGGGLVAVHSANNSFPDWVEYNKMVGLSGWGKRSEKHGPYVYFSEDGELIRDKTAGPAGTHGTKHEFQITARNAHPIIEGLPPVWMHTKDECYGKLRGPAENMTILASALCPVEEKGTGRHEPMLIVVEYGKGRVFNTTLGHDDYSLVSVGFITTFLRGAEWVATGEVSQAVPDDFPTENASRARGFNLITKP